MALDFEPIFGPFLLPSRLLPTRIYRKGQRAYWAGTLQDSYLHWPTIADFRAVNGQTLHVAAHTKEEGVLKLFLDSEATGLIGLQQGYFLLHASCVNIANEAVIFAGMPGAGKSTTTAAFVRAGYAPLADDMVVVKIGEDGQPYVIPAGPQMKIWQTTAEGLGFHPTDLTPCFEGHNKFYYTFQGHYSFNPVPLKKIFLLHRSNRFGTHQTVPTTKVPFELLKHFPLPHQLLRGPYLQQHFQQSLQIARHAAVTLLRRPKDFEQLQLFVKTYAPTHFL